MLRTVRGLSIVPHAASTCLLLLLSVHVALLGLGHMQGKESIEQDRRTTESGILVGLAPFYNAISHIGR